MTKSTRDTLSATLLIAAMFVWTSSGHAQVVLNEFLASNGAWGQDADGNFEDWIELYNAGDTPVDLEGYAITDEAEDEPPDRVVTPPWVFPAVTIEPGGYLLVWASEKDRADPAELHTNFKLSRDGETIRCLDPAGVTIWSVSYPPQRRDTSMGRFPDGDSDGDEWFYFLDPTPNAPNSTVAYPELPSTRPVFSPTGGFFSRIVEVEITASPADAVVHYTVDGSVPDESSPRYRTPLRVTQTSVLRAIAYLDGEPLTEADAHTYFVNTPRGVPILSISSAPDGLFSGEAGIFANPTETGREWERSARAELFRRDGSREFGVGFGLRIHGGASRVNSDKHSLRMYFRSEYGLGRLRYPLFRAADGMSPTATPVEPTQRFDRLVLRGGYNDSWTHFSELARRNAIHLRDELVRRVGIETGEVGAHGTWVGVYLNGDYQGLYNLTERIDEEFLDSYYDHNQWDVIKEGLVRNGDDVAWNELLAFLANANVADPAAWGEVGQRVDLDNLSRYLLVNLWADNRDWPQRNWYAARERDLPGARWRFFHWDAEQTFSSNTEEVDADRDSLAAAREGNGPLAAIIARLLTSPEFRVRLVREYERQSLGALHPERVHALLDAEAESIAPEIPLESTRWGGGTVASWNAALDRVRLFIDARSDALEDSLYALLDEGDEDIPYPPPSALPLDTEIALLVGNATDLPAGDHAVRARLLRRGAAVDVIAADSDDPVAVAERYDLVLISSSVQPGTVGGDFNRQLTPHIFWETGLLAPPYDPLSESGGEFDRQSGVRYLDVEHAILDGLPRGAVVPTVTTETTLGFGAGEIGAGVTRLATDQIGLLHAVLVAEDGADLLNGMAAGGRTVFLPLGPDGFAHATGALTRLFDQSINWALGIPNPPDGPEFLRGDVNADTFVDVSDAVATLAWLFRGSPSRPCADAADVDDDGAVTITDAVALLDFLFRLGPYPRVPYPDAGSDPTIDALVCDPEPAL